MCHDKNNQNLELYFEPQNQIDNLNMNMTGLSLKAIVYGYNK